MSHCHMRQGSRDWAEMHLHVLSNWTLTYFCIPPLRHLIIWYCKHVLNIVEVL